MDHFAPLPALLGGLLIGLAASLLLFTHGRIAGISGMLARAIDGDPKERGFRLSFLLGLASAGFVVALVRGLPDGPATPLLLTAAAGFLVGLGTRMSNGCTSGHGVCGNSRLSRRSLVATCSFIASGALTVLLVRHLGAA